MKESLKKDKTQRVRSLSMLLKHEVKNHIKPLGISFCIYIAALAFAVLSILYIEPLVNISYTILYVAVILHAMFIVIIPTQRVVLDIKKAPLFASDDNFPKSPRPDSGDFALAKLIPVSVSALILALMHATADAALTVLGGHIYDGYPLILVSVSIIIFSFLFYITSVAVSAAADYTQSSKNPRRRVVYSGVLLYTIGLVILVFVILCLSTVPLGSDAIADMSESGLNPITAVWLSLIYLAVSTLRVIGLYFIAKKRLRRALKLS